MSTKKKEDGISADDIFTYLHKRIARLERSAGLKVHPHPTEFDQKDDEEEDKRLAKEKQAQEEAKQRERDRAAKEQKQSDMHKEADSTSELSVGSPE